MIYRVVSSKRGAEVTHELSPFCGICCAELKAVRHFVPLSFDFDLKLILTLILTKV